MSSTRIVVLVLASLVALSLPTSAQSGEESADPGDYGCYIYYTVAGRVPTYWEETNFLGGLQRERTRHDGEWIPADKGYGASPVFWGTNCVLIGVLEQVCGDNCPTIPKWTGESPVFGGPVTPLVPRSA